MFGIFKAHPTRKLDKQYSSKLHEAMQAQRAGDIRKYSELTAEAEAIRAHIEAIEAKNSAS